MPTTDVADEWRRIAGEYIVSGPEAFRPESMLVFGTSYRPANSSDPVFPIDFVAKGEIFDARAADVLCYELSGAELDQVTPLLVDVPARGADWTMAAKECRLAFGSSGPTNRAARSSGTSESKWIGHVG